MLNQLLFAIPLSSYITLSVVVMIAWAFFVMTKLQIDTATGQGKRADRPEPTPFTFFKPGDNPTGFIPTSTLSEEELRITVKGDKNKPGRQRVARGQTAATQSAPTAATVEATQENPTEQPLTHNAVDSTNAEQESAPAAPPINADLSEPDNTEDEYALYQPRQVSVVSASPILGIVLDAEPEQATEPTTEQRKTLQDLQHSTDERALNRKRKTEQLMKLAAGLDFEAYVALFRTYFDQATAAHQQEPERAFYILFGELIASESADVQEQLLMLLDKEAVDEEPGSLIQVTVHTEEEEPAFT